MKKAGFFLTFGQYLFSACNDLGLSVNYRYIVDRLFGAAELRLDGEKGDIVRIERTDGIARGK